MDHRCGRPAQRGIWSTGEERRSGPGQPIDGTCVHHEDPAMQPLPLGRCDRPLDCPRRHPEATQLDWPDRLGCRDEPDLARVGWPLHDDSMPMCSLTDTASSTDPLSWLNGWGACSS